MMLGVTSAQTPWSSPRTIAAAGASGHAMASNYREEDASVMGGRDPASAPWSSRSPSRMARHSSRTMHRRDMKCQPHPYFHRTIIITTST